MSTFEEEVERKRLEAVKRIKDIPISALIWGPSPTVNSPLAEVRKSLKEVLVGNGHHVRFSEELIDESLDLSILAQQVTHVEAFDIVFSLPDSPGSIAEVHDFARIPSVSSKIVAFLDSRWNSGYSNQSLLQLESTMTCKTQLYFSGDLPNCIIEKALSLISRLQEFFYLTGRRFG